MRRAVAVLACLAVLSPATPAAAAPATVTWTVQPAGTNGPDGRRWAEHTLDPGGTVTDHLAVRNLGDATAVFALKAADGYLTENGRFNMLPSDRRSADGGTWISVQETVTVAAGRTVVVPFTVTAPADAAPGDHPAGIAASIAGKRGTVQVESRVGFRVLLRASGTLRPALAVFGVTTRFRPNWNPLRPGTLHVAYTVANTGNVRAGIQGRVAGNRADLGELLPGGSRTATAAAESWPLGRIRTTLTLTPVVPGAAAEPHTVTVTTWALPWPQVLALAAVAVLILLARMRRARLKRLLEQARLEGRRSAGATTP
ncbi:DUF916 domain-containing protein [Actinoplanes hulinensis]|uniref:DUF916 domain-containing protein n=1 Tax=Actinoplanes hulinensis TaxID=1144547 RepID=A0ABS7B7I4_9ACTN|nr:DUF916 domain-containing protein [Actinoplanes hulinensis]MBW6437012.1 DUF916 domain-containing protein [Actinoplanes hulinensis]